MNETDRLMKEKIYLVFYSQTIASQSNPKI